MPQASQKWDDPRLTKLFSLGGLKKITFGHLTFPIYRPLKMKMTPKKGGFH
jgi:hypothetical protein